MSYDKYLQSEAA